MIDDMLIGLVILDDPVTGQNYLYVFFLWCGLPEQLVDVSFATQIAVYLQHDGAPTHYTRSLLQQFNDAFPSRWIGRDHRDLQT